MFLKLFSLIVLLILLESTAVAQMISDCTGLQNMNNNLAGNYALAHDVDCSATVTWNAGAGFVPIGSSSTPFAGTFNGQNYAIYNLTINLPAGTNVGLFGYVNGANVIIMQVGLKTVNIKGKNTVGGLMGYNNGGTIINSYVTGSVIGSVVSGGGNVGGLIGLSVGAISQCYATASASGYIDVGGLVGNNQGPITNSYATGSVTGSTELGGLTGATGFMITNSYSTGSVTGSTYAGGLVGRNGGFTITTAYWNTQTSGQATSSGGIALTTQAMQQPIFFVGWDFTSTWVMNPGYTYPLLQALIVSPVLSNPLSNITQYIGTLLQLTIPANTFTDPNGLRLTYSAKLAGGSPLPAWLLFDPATQTFTGTPLSGAQGALIIVASVYNIPSQLISDVFQLQIPNRPPVINAPFTQQVALNGQSFQFIVPEATFSDVDGDRLQLTTTAANNISLPAWLSFNAPLGIFSGIATHRGSVWINVTANDGFGGQISTLLSIVTPNTAPQTTATFPNQIFALNQPFNFTIPTNLFFDLDGDSLIYSASLLGGGELLPWLSFNAQTLMLQGTPNAIGFLMLSVTATDPYNTTASLNFGVSISDLTGNSPPVLAIQILDQTTTVGAPFTLTLTGNMFIDPNGDPLTYSVTQEGGTSLPSWLNFSSTLLLLSGVPPITDILHITVRAQNTRGGFALDTFTLAIISNQNLPPFLQNPISNQAISVGGNYKFTIPSNTFIDVNNAPLNYSATESGSRPLPDWLHFNSSTRTFSGTPSDTDTNTYSTRTTTIEVRANNQVGSAVTTFQLSVTGQSQTEKIINALITLASIVSTAFAIYRNRAFLWNTFLKKIYEKEAKHTPLNESFTYSFSVPSKKIMGVKAFNEASTKLAHKKFCGCLNWFNFNRYQELHDYNKLPAWLQFNRNNVTISGIATEAADLYICAEGFDGRYLEAFQLRCGQPQGKDTEMQNI